MTGFASYGITDRIDIGTAVPVTLLRFSGQRVNMRFGQATLQADRAGTTGGVGDISLNVRTRLTGDTGTGLAAGVDLPTGREEDLLGAGKTAWRFLGIGSWERGFVAAHVNDGVGIGGVSDEQFVAGAVTVAAGLRVSLVGELLARRLDESVSRLGCV